MGRCLGLRHVHRIARQHRVGVRDGRSERLLRRRRRGNGHVRAGLWPDLIIVGGGVSKKAEKWVPLLTTRARVVPAELQNDAGIVGAALAAHERIGQ